MDAAKRHDAGEDAGEGNYFEGRPESVMEQEATEPDLPGALGVNGAKNDAAVSKKA